MNVALALATVTPALQGAPSLRTGVTHRGPPSVHVQKSNCILTVAELTRICEMCEIDLDLVSPLLPLPCQTAYDPPVGY